MTTNQHTDRSMPRLPLSPLTLNGALDRLLDLRTAYSFALSENLRRNPYNRDEHDGVAAYLDLLGTTRTDEERATLDRYHRFYRLFSTRIEPTF
jgi:hypothetical protein